MRRGEIWWSQQPQPIGKRPVLLLSRNEAYNIRKAVTIAQITTTIRHIPVEVLLDKSDGLSKPCVVNLDTVTTVSKVILTEKIAVLTPEKMRLVHKALKFALALD